MSLAKIESALITAFRDGSFFSDANTAWENTAFTTSTNDPWCQVNFLPSEPDVVTLGPDGFNEQRGVFQISLFYPSNTGSGPAKAKADEIITAFPTGRKMTYSGQDVVIRKSGCSSGEQYRGHYRLYVSIYFYAHVNR